MTVELVLGGIITRNTKTFSANKTETLDEGWGYIGHHIRARQKVIATSEEEANERVHFRQILSKR